MRNIINRKPFNLSYTEPAEITFTTNVIAHNLEIEFECGPSMLNKKIHIRIEGWDGAFWGHRDFTLDQFKSFYTTINKGEATNFVVSRILLWQVHGEPGQVAVSIRESEPANFF